MTTIRRAAATAVALLSLAASALAGASPASAAGPSCPDLTDYGNTVFSHATQIDNNWLPLVPGTRRVYTGTVQNDLGQPEAHTVTFTVTDVTKLVQGVNTVAVWDVDSSPAGVQESELSLWAQDDAGFVWNMGEYPEEFQGGAFVGAPSVWLAGYKSSTPGVHMAPEAVLTTSKARSFYSQGYSPTIEFEDCGRVTNANKNNFCLTNSPTTCYDHVVLTEEKDAFDPASGLQTKAYAPGIGIVKIGAINDPLGETLELTSLTQLNDADRADANANALNLDARAYTYGGSWSETEHAVGPTPPPPVEPPPVQPPPNPPPSRPGPGDTNTQLLRLTLDRSKSTVRRALTQRLRSWRIRSLKCKRASGTRVNCTFVATTKRGSRATGTAAVTRRGAEGLVRYSIAAKVVKGGCRPASSSRCTRRSTWRSR